MSLKHPFKPHKVYKKELEIISVKKCILPYVFHGTNKNLKTLDPSHNTKIGLKGHELGVPVVYASKLASDAFCYTPIESYKKQRKKLKKSAYYRITYKNRKFLLGANFGGYIYVCKGSDFYEIKRKDFENNKWVISTEWITDKKVKPLVKIKISKPFEWECIPAYEFIGYHKVGELPASEYLRYVKDEKIKEKIKKYLKTKFNPVFPKKLKKYT